METKFREPPLKTLKYVHSCRYISPSPPLVNSSYTRDYFRVNSPLRCKETKIEVERGSPRSPPSVKFWEGLMLEWRPNLEPAWCPLPSKQTLKIETKFRDPPLKYVNPCRYKSPPPQLKSYKECAGGGGVTKIPYIKWLAMNWFHSNGIFRRINSVYILTIMHILCMWDIELYCSWTQHIYDHQYHS